MLNTVAALAALWALSFASSSGPVPYEAVVANEIAAASLAAKVDTEAVAADKIAALSDEQQAHMLEEADWRASARLYHAGGGGATGNDSLGCRPIAMRTVATDPRVIPRRTRLFIRETVGLEMADGTKHDGYWYASDTGGAIRGAKIDLFTGHGRGSMRPAMPLNMKTLTVVDAGDFEGCPPAWETASS
ncbi:3D domain-containing protein [Brevundimonas sp. BH3]|uniref:3D domain-containing protein n=1 Tax=unclassified Brevundimonas TaxID=2622653 RepID=UPI00289EAED0|nr:3D domain-containing protein [Brevundimonas sp.]